MQVENGEYFISTEPRLLDHEFICRSLQSTYWANERPREVILESLQHSLCFGVYRDTDRAQVGFARVVTDRTTFSWVCDVFIAEEFRGRGLGTWLMATVVGHPWVKYTRSTLGTRDAHGLYERFGFVRHERLVRRADPREDAPPPASGR